MRGSLIELCALFSTKVEKSKSKTGARANTAVCKNRHRVEVNAQHHRQFIQLRVCVPVDNHLPHYRCLAAIHSTATKRNINVSQEKQNCTLRNRQIQFNVKNA